MTTENTTSPEYGFAVIDTGLWTERSEVAYAYAFYSLANDSGRVEVRKSRRVYGGAPWSTPAEVSWASGRGDAAVFGQMLARAAFLAAELDRRFPAEVPALDYGDAGENLQVEWEREQGRRYAAINLASYARLHGRPAEVTITRLD